MFSTFLEEKVTFLPISRFSDLKKIHNFRKSIVFFKQIFKHLVHAIESQKRIFPTKNENQTAVFFRGETS